jgi:hypothetical protein
MTSTTVHTDAPPSRLFHTLVVLGLQLGIGTGCGGEIAVQERGRIQRNETFTPDVTDAGLPTEDAAVTLTDAADSAATPDAIAKAFCDVPWPTTKGNPRRPVCLNPNTCTEQPAERVFVCYKVVEDGCFLRGPTSADIPQRYPNCGVGRFEGELECSPGSVDPDVPVALTGPCSCPGTGRGTKICNASLQWVDR